MLLLLLVILWTGSGWNWHISIPHRKYQVKPHQCLWFSAACAAAMAHRNHFYCLYQQIKSFESTVKFRWVSNHCKRVLEAAKLPYVNKTKESMTSQKLGSRDFWQIPNSPKRKVNLLYLVYLTAQKCCLLHLT